MRKHDAEKSVTLKNIAGGVLHSLGTLLLAPLKSFGTTLGKVLTSIGLFFESPLKYVKGLFAAIGKAWLSLHNLLMAPFRALAVGIGEAFLALFQIPGAIYRIAQSIAILIQTQGIFGALATGFRALGALFISNPVGLALLALAAIVMFVAANWQTFKQVAETVWNKIKFAVSDVVDSLKLTFKDFGKEIEKSFDDIITTWNKLTGSSETSGSAISKIIHTLGSVITAAVTIIATAIEGIIKAILIVVQTIVGVLSGIIKFVGGVFAGDWAMAWEGIKQVFVSIFGGIGNFILNIFDTIGNGIDRLMGRTTKAAQQAKDIAAGEVQMNESNVSAAGVALSRRRAADAAENASLGRPDRSIVAAEIDTSKAQAGLDSVGEASRANAEAIQNNATATENLNANLQGASESAEKYKDCVDDMTGDMPEDIDSFGQAVHGADENISDFNTNVGSSKQALQEHSTVTSTSKDAIQQLGDTANAVKDFVKMLGEAAAGAVENVRLLGERAGATALSFLNIDSAAQALVTAFKNAVDSIANIKITAPTVTIPVAAPLPADNNNTTPASEPGHNFIGTNFWRGGMTWVHEQGPELIDLPSGTRIVPHSRSLQEEYQRGYDTAMLQSSNVMLPFKLGNDTTKNPSSKLREAEDTGNANSIFNEDFVNNPSSIFAKDTVNNASSNIGNETVSNPQSNIDVRTVSNASSIFSKDVVSNVSSNIESAEGVGNAQSDISVNDNIGYPQTNVAVNDFRTNPQTSISTESVSNAQSNIHSNNQGQNVYAPNMNFTIAKIADTLVIREEADISRLADRVINKFAFLFQAHANNRVVGAVR